MTISDNMEIKPKFRPDPKLKLMDQGLRGLRGRTLKYTFPKVIFSYPLDVYLFIFKKLTRLIPSLGILEKSFGLNPFRFNNAAPPSLVCVKTNNPAFSSAHIVLHHQRTEPASTLLFV